MFDFGIFIDTNFTNGGEFHELNLDSGFGSIRNVLISELFECGADSYRVRNVLISDYDLLFFVILPA